MANIKLYGLIAVVGILLFMWGKSCTSNRDLKTERKFLKQQNLEIKEEINTLHEDQKGKMKLIEQSKLDIKKQDIKIDSLEKARDKVVYVPVTVKEVDTTGSQSIVEQINKGRKCCGELLFADSTNKELKAKSLYQSEVINNQDSLIDSLSEEINLVNQRVEIAEAKSETYRKELRRVKWQRNAAGALTVVVIILSFL